MGAAGTTLACFASAATVGCQCRAVLTKGLTKGFRSPAGPTAGAFGCTISGAGPTAVAIVRDQDQGHRVKEAMVGLSMSLYECSYGLKFYEGR